MILAKGDQITVSFVRFVKRHVLPHNGTGEGWPKSLSPSLGLIVERHFAPKRDAGLYHWTKWGRVWLNMFNADLSPKRDWRGHPLKWEKTETIPIATLSPPEWLCVKMNSDESHFNRFINCEGQNKSQRQCPQITTTEEKRRAEAKSNRGPFTYEPKRLTARPNLLTWSREN